MGPIGHLARVPETPLRPGRYGPGHMRRSALCLVQLLLSLTALHAASLAWVRILAGNADPVLWTPGAAWPARPALFPFAPSAVLSYATVRPGDELADAELEARASRWERALAISGRFSVARVYVVELEGAGADGGPRRGLIVEAEPVDAPCFDGGAAYASVELPLFRASRESLLVAAGANRAELAYRDDTLGDAPFVLASSLRYDNDLLQTGRVTGNRLSGSLASGARLGSYGDLLGGCRIETPLAAPPEGGEPLLVAADLTLELVFPELLGIRALDADLSTTGSAYPGSTALRLFSRSELWLDRDPFDLKAAASLGLSSGGLDGRDLFSPGVEGLDLMGRDGERNAAREAAALGVDCDLALMRWTFGSWLPATLGPFVAAQGAILDSSALASLGAGLRLRLGPPVSLWCDLGWALDREGEGALVFAVTARPIY